MSDENANQEHVDLQCAGYGLGLKREHTGGSLSPIRSDEPEFVGPLDCQVALIVALGKARAAFKKLTKDTKGQSGHQEYKYATFAAVEDATSEALAAAEIGWTQTFTSSKDDTEVMLLTTIVAGHGAQLIVRQWWSTQTGCPNSSDGKPRSVKDLGGLQTYNRRYALQAILGVEGDRDEDQNPNPAGFRREPPPARRQGPPQRRQGKPPPSQGEPMRTRPSKQEPPPEAQPEQQEKPVQQDPPVPMMNDQQKTQIGRLFEVWASDRSRADLNQEEAKMMFGRKVHSLTKLAPKDLTFAAANQLIEHLETELSNDNLNRNVEE